MNKFNNQKLRDVFKILISLILIFILQLNTSNGSTRTLQTTLQQFCTFLFDVVGTLISVMVVLSSISYTAGQMLGAELRARAVLWSQSMLSGAVIGILLIILVPYLIGKTWDQRQCNFT
jgi:hypothetical protein